MRKIISKKKLYTPYGFDEKVEYKIYLHVGEELRKIVLGKKVKKKDKGYPSFNSYLEWKEYFVKKFSGSCNWNLNFFHYLKRKLRISERMTDFFKAVAVPLYIAEISGLMAIYQFAELIATKIIILLVTIIITLIASLYLVHKYDSKVDFYTDCIDIVNNIDTSH